MTAVEPARLVIFDVFNTIVTPRAGQGGTFAEGLLARDVAPDLLPTLQRRSEGLAHPEPSASRSAYVDWCSAALDRVAAHGLGDEVAPLVVPALEQLHQGRMEPRPGVVELLTDLRDRGITIAVCSNWSWDLASDLADCGLLDLIDVVVASAQAGHRKPHPAIYQRVLREARATAASSLFVGDSLTADVLGPERAGISAVHLLRTDDPSTAERQIDDIADVRTFVGIPRPRTPGN